MLRLGPLVVYPVELTHRAVTMPRHGATNDATDAASAMSHRALGSWLSKFTTCARTFSPCAPSFPRRSVSVR